MTPYPPSTPFMQLDFADREAVFNTALQAYARLLRTPPASMPALAMLCRLQLYVCGDPEVGLEPWMLSSEEGAMR